MSDIEAFGLSVRPCPTQPVIPKRSSSTPRRPKADAATPSSTTPQKAAGDLFERLHAESTAKEVRKGHAPGVLQSCE